MTLPHAFCQSIRAAAGNDGCACLHVPAALPSVLAVGAMDEQGQPFDFSNWGESYQLQGILAPGSNILGATPGGGIVAKSGTSFATPLVSGVAALLLSLQRKRGEKPNPHAVREAILASVAPCDPQMTTDCRRFLRGRLTIPGAYTHFISAEKRKMVQAKDPANRTSLQTERVISAAETSNLVSEQMIYPTTAEYTQTFKRSKSMSDPNQTVEEVELETTPCQTQEVAIIQPQSIPTLTTRPAGALFTNRQNNGAVRPSQVRPAQAEGEQLVYALGALGYDFGTDARRDWFDHWLNVNQETTDNKPPDIKPPEDAKALMRVMDDFMYVADSLIWTLNLEATPIYAIKPEGPFAATTYDKLREFLNVQLETQDGATYTRLAVPGILQGSVMLRSGQVVPVIVPDARGLEQITPDQIKPASKRTVDTPSASLANTVENPSLDPQKSMDISKELLYRLFYELRNLGLTPQDRAKNAMSVYGIGGITSNPEFATYVLEGVSVEKSPVCRPGSDCWDVLVTAFDPADRLAHARLIFRQTIDVSDVIPTQMGTLRRWFAY